MESYIQYIGISLAIISIIYDIIVFISFIKTNNSKNHLKIYQSHILIFSVINSIYIILYQIHRLEPNLDCKLIVFIQDYSFMPLLTTALCICIINLLIIRGDSCLIMHKVKMNIVMTLLIWLLPAIRIGFVVYLILKGSLDFFHNECLIQDDMYSLIYYAYIIAHYLGIFIICLIIIAKLCKIKSNLMIYSHKPLICKMVMYIIMLFLFAIIDILIHITREFNEDPLLRSLFLSVTPLMNIFLVYTFNWNQKVKESCYNMCFGKQSKEYFNDEF